jgi:uncharacterized damage-inducible protein DinB
MTISELTALFSYNSWANHRILELVAAMPEELFLKDLKSSHGGIHGTLVHSLGAQETWLKRFQGVSPTSFPSTADVPTFAELKSRWETVEANERKFLSTLKSDSDLQAMLTYSDLKGNSYTQPLIETIQQVLNHGTYHRGQVVTMLRQLGIKPVNTDMITWFRLRQQEGGAKA